MKAILYSRVSSSQQLVDTMLQALNKYKHDLMSENIKRGLKAKKLKKSSTNG